MRSMQWRIAVPFFLIFLVIIVIADTCLLNVLPSPDPDEQQSRLEYEAGLIAAASVPYFSPAIDNDALVEFVNSFGTQVESEISVVSPDGEVLANSETDSGSMENLGDKVEIRTALSTGTGVMVRDSGEGEALYVAVLIEDENGVLGIVRVSEQVQEPVNSAGRVAVVILLELLVAVVLTVLVARLITRRADGTIREITRAAEKISSGELNQSVSIDTEDEFQELAYTFNEMSSNLRKQVKGINDERNRLHTIIANLSDGVIMADIDGTTAMVNKAAGWLFGFSPGSIANRPVIELVRDYEIAELMKNCLETQQVQSVNFETGFRKRFVRAVAIPVVTNVLNGVLILVQDLTEMRSLQTMRSELIGNISHEFRTPLAGVKAMVETLRDGAIDDRDVALDFLGRIDDEVNRITQMVSELTELSRIESGRAELQRISVNLNGIVDDVMKQLEPQAERKGIELVRDFDGKIPNVFADPDRIRQVLVNLVHNAVKFTGQGGRITARTQVVDGEVNVEVEDTGIGISNKVVHRVFERFYKADKARSSQGTGMGLAIARHIVEAHGGTIRVTSEEEKGSTFTFSLPVSLDQTG